MAAAVVDRREPRAVARLAHPGQLDQPDHPVPVAGPLAPAAPASRRRPPAGRSARARPGRGCGSRRPRPRRRRRAPAARSRRRSRPRCRAPPAAGPAPSAGARSRHSSSRARDGRGGPDRPLPLDADAGPVPVPGRHLAAAPRAAAAPASRPAPGPAPASRTAGAGTATPRAPAVPVTFCSRIAGISESSTSPVRGTRTPGCRRCTSASSRVPRHEAVQRVPGAEQVRHRLDRPVRARAPGGRVHLVPAGLPQRQRGRTGRGQRGPPEHPVGDAVGPVAAAADQRPQRAAAGPPAGRRRQHGRWRVCRERERGHASEENRTAPSPSRHAGPDPGPGPQLVAGAQHDPVAEHRVLDTQPGPTTHRGRPPTG